MLVASNRFAGVLLALLTVACGTDGSALPSESTTDSTPPPTASLQPSPVESKIEPSASFSTAEPTSAPTLSAEPIGEDPEATCRNTEVGYSLSYPASWYVLPAEISADACTALGPNPFSDVAEAAILVADLDGGCFERQGPDPIETDHFTVDGFSTVRREFPVDWNGPGVHYVVDLNLVPVCGDESHVLVFEMDHDAPGEWETNKGILERIVATLEFDE
ncbi:MAG: hypothetical protein ACRDGD_06765 [Candidatus Limnocylindria bacterium]